MYVIGHVEQGEDLLQTAYRETEEEAGISKNDLLLTNYSETINVCKLVLK